VIHSSDFGIGHCTFKIIVASEVAYFFLFLMNMLGTSAVHLCGWSGPALDNWRPCSLCSRADPVAGDRDLSLGKFSKF